MSTLYRDYRPQNFSEVLGQNHIKITLQNEISVGRLAQAYLFCGPRAVGKTTLARVLAKAINCENKKDREFEPCNKCASCVSITAGKNLDIIEIDAASNTGVDNVRENIIAFSRLAPASAKFKVFIIDEVHMLSISAFNALLKIIEEPPAYVIFILCTTEIQKVPGTIISRCERFDFKRISVNEIVKKLTYIASQEKIVVAKEVLEAVARKSGGHLRDAESLLGQIFSLGDKEITLEQAELVLPHYNSLEALDLIDYLGRKDAAKAVALVNNLVDSGVNIKVFTTETIDLLRQIILNKLSPELANNLGLDLGENLEKRLGQVAANLDWDQLINFSRRLLEVASDNKTALIPQLPLELAIIELCFGIIKPSSFANGLSSGRESSSVRVKDNIHLTQTSSVAKTSNPDVSVALENQPSGQIINYLAAVDIMTRWPEFLVKIKKYNHSLSFVLQNCQPQEIRGGCLALVFKYKFHQDRINDLTIKNIVENTLAEVFSSPLTFSSTIDETLEIRQPEKEPEMPELDSVSNSTVTSQQSRPAVANNPISGGLMSDLLKTFGGEVVD